MNPSFLADFSITDFIPDLATYQEYLHKYNLLGLQKRLATSKEVILVHQMGKVGSSSIVKTLKRSSLNIPVTHTHFLNKNKLKLQIEHNLKHRNGIIKRHLIESLLILENIQDNHKKVQVVTIIREPISRNISTFFELINDRYMDDFYLNRDRQDITVAKLIQEFLAKKNHQEPLIWLEREISSVFGIDLYLQNFDFQQKYQIYQRDRVTILLLRLENINRSYCTTAFKDFLNMDDFILSKINIGNKKEYARLYSNFKQQIILPDRYINSMYQSKMVNHFYTPQEITEFRNIWSRKSTEKMNNEQ